MNLGCAFKKEGLTKIVEQLADNTVLRAIDLGGNFREGTSAKMVKLLEKLAQVWLLFDLIFTQNGRR